MRRFLRSVLLWVMVLAMPVQGIAASVMQSCGPSHARMMQGLLAVASAAAPMPAHAHANGPAIGHGDAHADGHAASVHGLPLSAQPAAGPSGDVEAGVVPDDGMLAASQGSFSCSACAACGAMPALLGRVTLPVPPGLAQPWLPSPSHPVPFQLPGGLDRPPRADLA